MEAKASNFLEQQKENVEDHYLGCIWHLLKGEKEDEDDFSKVVVAVSRGSDESSYALEKMEVRVFEFCLQRPKDVIFEGLVMRVWLW